MKYDQSLTLASTYMNYLRPACERIEIVGSVKRHDKEEVHDIEILLIPKSGYPRPNFGDKTVYISHLEKALDELVKAGIIRQPLRKANGERYKKFAICEHSHLNEFCLDLFIVRLETWVLQNVIRTGPSLFSHRFVTSKSATCYHKPTGKTYRGLLPDEYQYIRGETRIMRGMDTLVLPEEEDAISILGLGWIEPGERWKVALRTPTP